MIQPAWKRKTSSVFLSLLITFVGSVAFADGPPGTQHRVQQTAPIFLGTSGLNVKNGCGAGTLGSLVRKGTATYILSNNHVLVVNNAGTIGDAIVHLAPLDAVPPNCVGPPPPTQLTVAKLSNFVTIRPLPADNILDAAIAAVQNCGTPPVPCVDNTGAVLDLGNVAKPGLTDKGGPVSKTTVLPTIGLAVQKSGRTTGLTMASITAVEVTVVICGYGKPPGFCARFIDQIRMSGPVPVCRPGDSGSLWVDKSTPPKPVGLHFAGGTNGVTDTCIANPINVVLAAFTALLGGPVGFARTGLPGLVDEQTASGEAFQANPRAQAAIQVKRNYEDYLLQLPEAVGNGVGFSNSGSGEIVIKVFLRKLTSEALRALPTQLGAIRVELEVTGDIQLQ